VQHLRSAVLLQDGSGLSDGQLLKRFIERRDELAFEALVHRHGPMVMGVCRRVLRNGADAEDAFQATFLVLVRKARSVVPQSMVGNWLYGVARTTAVRAKVTAARRQMREKQVRFPPEPEVVQQDLAADLRPLLDRELSRLPEKYRVPIVLCDLECKSRKEVAGELGIPEGTVAGRLVRARALLGKRLARHGFGVSAGILADMLSQNAASAHVPTFVVSSTVRAASLFAAGGLAEGVISSNVVALTNGVLKTMFLNKLQLAGVALLIGVGIVLGTRPLISSTSRAEDVTSQEKKAVTPDQAPKEVSAWDLIQVYSSNEALADEKFTDRRVRVTGAVLKVKRLKNEFKDPHYYGVTLYDRDARAPVNRIDRLHPLFRFGSDARAELAVLGGHTVTIEGECKGPVQIAGEERILFVNCKIEKTHAKPETQKQGADPRMSR
jgi:RNA polymerase sigma factor (sigma-70 family)